MLATLASACGASAPPVSSAASAGARVGDYVVYRYAGRLIGPDPMLLMEEVVERDGDRVVVEVTLSRGHETVRTWRQTVAVDALVGGRPSHVDALCQLDGGACAPLANEGNADLLRMYEGLFVTPDAPATSTTTSDETVDVGGTEMTCHVTRSEIVVAGEPRTMKETECPDFLWTHAGTAVEMPDKRRVLYVTVKSFGAAE